MNAPIRSARISRRTVLKTGTLTVGFALMAPKAVLRAAAQGAAPRVLDPKKVDAFLEVHADGAVTLFSGKVDLGQGLRISLRQIVAEELNLPVDRVKMVEGDTALTPNQGRTSGSNGIQQGGMQIRQASATARKALMEFAAKRLNVAAADLIVANGEVRPKAGGAGVTFADLLGGKQFDLALDPKAPLKDPASYTIVGKPMPRPDVPAKVTGTNRYVHDFTLPGMLHGRVIRPPTIGAELVSVDESSVGHLPGVKVVRIKNFLAVVAEDEWTCVRAMSAIKAQWSDWNGLPEQGELIAALRAGPFVKEESLVKKGDADVQRPADAIALKATYFWPNQTHGSIGPSCAVADVTADRATIWTASQGTHGNQQSFAKFLALPRDKVRLIYLEGSGCYGMNGHEDAAADAAILSRAVGRPVRVQWMRADEHAWDPKGPPQLLDLAAAVDRAGQILDWRTDMWIPQATPGLPNIPLVGPDAAGLDQGKGIGTGQLSQNGDPPYAAKSINVIAHWLRDTPLRPAPIRSPGKPANCFALESFFDELAAAAKLDPVAMRLKGLSDPRAIEVVKRVAATMKWDARPSPGPNTSAAVARGRGFSYVHYKHSEAYVAMGMEVAVDRASGIIKVERIVCAHDCGQMINPDGVRSQVEGSILQTLSRVLMEEVKFDRSRVTSVDWATYPILRFSQVPKLEIELIDRPNEKPVGAGEASTAPVGAALGNAVFDAVGIRLRTVPFTPERVKAAFDRNTT
jgi:CO/xanthine dehydrogenase Mo-binding subunit